MQRNQSATFSSGKVRPNHEANINMIARRTGKDVNSHTVRDGIITSIMATIQRINIIFFFNDTATTEIYTLSLHDALPICFGKRISAVMNQDSGRWHASSFKRDRKSTRLNSSHSQISYAVFCLKKKDVRGRPSIVTQSMTE